MTDQVHKLGEVLRAAREAKGVDLPRVERETKIRERYLSALERGEYRDLPGAVYTKGFLRNYGSYLGLDSEYLIDLYRLETATTPADRPSLPAPPRPIGVRRRRTFVITPGAVVAALLTVMVGALVAWLGYEFVNFAREPELRIVQPAGDISAHTEATITIRGITEANATVTVSGLPENPSVTADPDGAFEVTVGLLPGSNEIHLVALDPLTNRTSPEFVRRVNVVADAGPSSSPVAAAPTVEQPVADATLTGAVAVAGTATAGAPLVLSATLVTAGTPAFTITDGAGAAVPIAVTPPTAPAASTLTAGTDGAFNGSLSLAPGTWDVTLTPEGGEPITRRVTVQPGAGLAGALRIMGGQSYLEVSQDGTALASVSGGIADDGQTIEIAATDEIRIRAGNAGAVHVTMNGLAIGAMGASGAVVEWRIAAPAS